MTQQLTTQKNQQIPTASTPVSNVLQRKCACGQHMHGGGECAACRKKHLGPSEPTSYHNSVSDISNVNSDLLLSDNNINKFSNSSFEKDFSRVPTQNILPMRVQPKLKINQPGDKYEQEADQIAEQVMRIPESKHQNTNQSGERRFDSKITPLVRSSEKSSLSMEVASQIEGKINALRSGGKRLPETPRRFFEERFGTDFSEVRLHTDSTAASLANSINAKAFTLGKNIAFGNGQYVPDTNYGRNILAHELVHVVQQRGTERFNSRVGKSFFSPVTIRSDVLNSTGSKKSIVQLQRKKKQNHKTCFIDNKKYTHIPLAFQNGKKVKTYWGVGIGSQ